MCLIFTSSPSHNPHTASAYTTGGKLSTHPNPSPVCLTKGSGHYWSSISSPITSPTAATTMSAAAAAIPTTIVASTVATTKSNNYYY